MSNLIVIIIILVPISAAVCYLVRARKKGQVCIGCPNASSCTKCRSSASRRKCGD